MAATGIFRSAPDLRKVVLEGAEETGRSLGTGSFGSVLELRIGGVLCAGKKLHDILIDPQDRGAERMVSKFLQECKLISDLRHPHIAQFLGVCFLPSSSTPLLVTELLSDSLHNVLERPDDLPLWLRQSILTDVAKGLVYLHSRTPPIIHRDLTAHNVLLNTTMRAKITDFGNSHFVDPIENTKTMTRVPGTLGYMPPEALEPHSRYSAKLDLFSFGHLALFTITRVFPRHILAPNSHDPDTGKLIAHTEVERRVQYMQILIGQLNDSHPLVTLIQQCLHNLPDKRPTALEALDWLNTAIDLDNLDEEECVYDEHYERVYDHFHKVEMVQYINMKEIEKRKKEKEIEELRKQIDSMTTTNPNEVTDGNKTAPLGKLSRHVMRRQWKLYTFKIVDGTHLKYFKSGVKKPRGEIALSNVTDVLPVEEAEAEGFCFQVHFKGKQSPWLLSAYSERERKSWMEAILRRGAAEVLPQTPKIKDQPEDIYEEMYEEVPRGKPHEYEYVRLLPPPPKPPTEEEVLIYDEVPEEFNSTPKYPPFPTVTPSEVKRSCEEDPAYEATVAALDNTAPSLRTSQIDHLITMLQSVQKGRGNESRGPKNIHPSPADIPRSPPMTPPPQVTPFHSQSSHKKPDIYDTIPPKSPNLGAKRSLKKMLKSTTSLEASLLITEEESPDMYIGWPQWAKACTLYPRSDTLIELHQQSLYISPSALEDISEIGRGQFGMVFKALLKTKEQHVPVAVKIVDNITPDLQKEITIMMEIVHPNIVHLYGLINEGRFAPALVMEFLTHGNLKQFLTENKRDDKKLMKYMMDVAMGMHYLSEKGIIHRDLAARNILVDKNEMCKVADFGRVREVLKDSQVYVSESQGPSPLRWMAPESLTDRVFSHASDVWSFGILQWEMFNPTKMPYSNMVNQEMISNVAAGYQMPVPRGRPPLVIKIMKACWNKDPAKRPSFLLISNLLTQEMIGED